MLGFRGGLNLLNNDFNVHKLGPNLEGSARYGLSHAWSLGINLGYEELKSHQVPNTLALPFDYIKLHAYPVTFTAWFHPFQGNQISPFIYAGVGAMFYRRWDGIRYVPDNELNTSIHVPIGIGVEASLSSNLTFTIDASYRILDDLTETYSRGGPDAYAGLKAGFNFYVGTSTAEDDDSDGLFNGMEQQLGTNPQSADSDLDGLTDADEQRLGSDPTKTDTDHDGVVDGQEARFGMNPLAADSDADGISDLDEMKTRLATPTRKNTSALNPTFEALRDSIQEYDEHLEILQHFLEVSTSNPRRLEYTGLRRWVISNPTLRDSLFTALMAADSSLQSEAGAEAEVLSTPSADLIEVRFGNAVFKGMTLSNALEKSGRERLYERVAESYQYSKDVELRNPEYKLQTPVYMELMTNEVMLDRFDPLGRAGYPKPLTRRVDLSLYGLMFKAGPKWGGEIRFGNDELGYPFWSSGNISFLASYERIKFGFGIPFTGGRNASEFFPPFVIRGRQLNGTRGLVAEADFGPVGGKVSMTRLSEKDLDGLTDPTLFYYLTGITQAWYSFGVAITPTTLVRARVGGGVHRVNEATLGVNPMTSATVIGRGPNQNVFSPYVKLEFLNQHSSDEYGLSIQFYELTFLFTGSLEIIPNILSLEAKYCWPISPDRPPWQTPEFLIVSPHVRYSF